MARWPRAETPSGSAIAKEYKVTIYENLTRKIEALQDAGSRATHQFAEIWYGKAWELRQVRDGLTVMEAGREL